MGESAAVWVVTFWVFDVMVFRNDTIDVAVFECEVGSGTIYQDTISEGGLRQGLVCEETIVERKSRGYTDRVEMSVLFGSVCVLNLVVTRGCAGFLGGKLPLESMV